MSILLDHLSQQQKDSEKNANNNIAQHGLPDLAVSHFDDELLGDEWLMRRAKNWRLIAFILALLLIFSWSWFAYYFFKADLEQKEAEQQKTEQQTANQKNSDQQSLLAPPESEKNSQMVEASSSNVEKAPNSNRQQPAIKKAFKPEKRPAKSIENSHRSNSPAKQPQFVEKSASQKQTLVLLEELSSEEQQDFSQVNINSYVISDDADKSFIIMDDQLFRVNQRVTEKLVLRGITAEHIIFEYQSKLVKMSLGKQSSLEK